MLSSFYWDGGDRWTILREKVGSSTHHRDDLPKAHKPPDYSDFSKMILGVGEPIVTNNNSRQPWGLRLGPENKRGMRRV